jgi:molecular chaperone GrpE
VEKGKPNFNPPDVAPEDSSSAEVANGKLGEVIAERDRLAAEKAELEDRALRSRAEFDNFRRRADQAKSEYFQFAAMEMVRELLPVLEDFERALQVETTDAEYAKGIQLIYNRFSERLKKAGLEPIETAGRQFDPNVHEAVQRTETADADDQAILKELQRGYKFKGKLLRPAWVQVAVKP